STRSRSEADVDTHQRGNPGARRIAPGKRIGGGNNRGGRGRGGKSRSVNCDGDEPPGDWLRGDQISRAGPTSGAAARAGPAPGRDRVPTDADALAGGRALVLA